MNRIFQQIINYKENKMREVIQINKIPEIKLFRRLRVAAYIRVSSPNEMAINSLENQAITYQNLIQTNPQWELVGIYEDKGISGTLECRPAFQKMLAHETSDTETHYGARLRHSGEGINVLTIDAGGIRALIAHYATHRTDLGNGEDD